MDAINTDEAPAAVGPYSQGVATGEWIFCSGQIPLRPGRGKEPVSGSIEDETRQVLRNLEAVVTAGGGKLSTCVQTWIYLTDLGDFAAVNGIYEEFFARPHPARVTVEVSALPLGARVEIAAMARRA